MDHLAVGLLSDRMVTETMGEVTGWSDPAATAPQTVLDTVLAQAPFNGHVTVQSSAGAITADCDYIVAIPVRDEAELLPRALHALGRAMDAVPGSRGALVIVANDSTDRSARIARDWASKRGVEHLVIEALLEPGIRDAPHVRRLALDLAALHAPRGTIFTTDADSYVGPGWIREALPRTAQGVDLLCEEVRLDEAEALGLPDRVRLVGDVERAYFAATGALWRKWTCGATLPLTVRASGASLAMRTEAYHKIGRLPLPDCGEDRALCDAMMAGGLVVESRPDSSTRTSARLVARAQGGCAAALAERASLINPYCDSLLLPVDVLRRRATGAHRRAPRCDAHAGGDKPMLFSEVLRELSVAIELLGADA